MNDNMLGKILAGQLERGQSFVDSENANSLTSKLLGGVIGAGPLTTPNRVNELVDELADEVAKQYREWLDSPEGKDFYKK